MNKTNENDIRMLWLTLANHHDSVLQSYRMIFITAETILIGFGTLLLANLLEIKTFFILILFPLIFGLYLIHKWEQLADLRGLYVFYCNTNAVITERFLTEGKENILVNLNKENKDEIRRMMKNPYNRFLEWKYELTPCSKFSKEKIKKANEKINLIRENIGLQKPSKEFERCFLGERLPNAFTILWFIIPIIRLLLEFLKS